MFLKNILHVNGLTYCFELFNPERTVAHRKVDFLNIFRCSLKKIAKARPISCIKSLTSISF